MLWNLRARFSDGESRYAVIPLPADLLAWIIRTFRSLWPATRRPGGVTTGDTNDWDASEYLLVTGSSPATAADLQAAMIEELVEVQAKIASDDVDSWQGFFDDDGKPYGEERCCDHLLGLLRQGCDDIQLNPEVHVGNDKEVDIGCTVGKVRVPIEVKGQWNRDLWHAANTQLARFYSADWRAERRGIYLVLWFGATGKALRTPPPGVPRPNTPVDLRNALMAQSKIAQDGLVDIVVLDLSRP